MTDATTPRAANFGEDTLIARLGMDITEMTAQRVVGRMPVAGNTQPRGFLHGGATAALAETLGSLGAYEHAGETNVAMGVDLNITHHRAVSAGHVIGTATAIYLGRTVATYAITVVDEAGKTVATARLTCAVRPREGT